MNDEVKKYVYAALKETFPVFAVRIQESQEDISTLWVQVFGVPTDQVRRIKNFIHDLQDMLPRRAETILLPMVKDIEVTRQYYPQYLPQVAEDKERGTLLRSLLQRPLSLQPRWPSRNTSVVCNAADEQLALAA